MLRSRMTTVAGSGWGGGRVGTFVCFFSKKLFLVQFFN